MIGLTLVLLAAWMAVVLLLGALFDWLERREEWKEMRDFEDFRRGLR